MNLQLKPGLRSIFGIIYLMVILPASNMTTIKASENQPDISAQIESQAGDGIITFTGLAINYGGQEYLCTYKMIARRSGQSGRCNNQQSGAIHLKPGNTTQLSKMTISATSADSYKVTLQIYFNESVIASDSLAYIPD